jgi:hypothetical protein
MKHVSIYENFGVNSPSVIDFFDLTFTLVLRNRTVIKGLIQNEDSVKELFSDNQQYKLIDSCYPFQTRYTPAWVVQNSNFRIYEQLCSSRTVPVVPSGVRGPRIHDVVDPVIHDISQTHDEDSLDNLDPAQM